MTTPAITYHQLYAFLKARYHHERFEGRNHIKGWENYSHAVTESHMHDLAHYSRTCISPHESANGVAVWYTAADVAKEVVQA